MNVKAVFVIPPSEALKLRFVSYQQPINLGYLAAAVIDAGFEAEIWDYGMEEFDERRFIERIRSTNPQVVGFHCKTFNIIQGHALALAVKGACPGAVTIVGGPHSSALPVQTVEEFRHFDAVVVGEGERTIVEICEKVSLGHSIEDVDGLAIRKNGVPTLNTARELIKDLDTVKYPARHLFSKSLYNRYHATRGISTQNRNVTEIFTSRGCPHRCIFCAVNVAYGNRVRFRSVDNVLGEIDECLNRFKYDHIVFQDDTFTLRKDRTEAFIKGFRRLGLKSWSCDTRVDTIDKELLKEMASSGCKKVSFGAESGSDRILRLAKKGITVEQIRNAVRWARQAGIEIVECPFIIGSHPDETLDDIRMTWRLIKDIKPDILSVTTIVPYPGTEIYGMMKEAGYLTDEHWTDFQMMGRKFNWRTKNFSSAELSRLQQQLINRYYFSPGYIVKLLRKIKSIEDLRYWARAGMDYLRFLCGGR